MALGVVEQAAELCCQRGGSFREELEAHLLHGYVFSTPELFLLGRPMPRSADTADIWQSYPREECDAWFVWLGIGPAAALARLMPYPLPWIGWTRQGRPWREAHWLLTEALQKRLQNGSRQHLLSAREPI